jgi:hypothetical protein
MILLKSRPKCSPTHFSLNLMHNFYCEKGSHKSLGFFCHLKKNYPKKTIAQWAKIRPIYLALSA